MRPPNEPVIVVHLLDERRLPERRTACTGEPYDGPPEGYPNTSRMLCEACRRVGPWPASSGMQPIPPGEQRIGNATVVGRWDVAVVSAMSPTSGVVEPMISVELDQGPARVMPARMAFQFALAIFEGLDHPDMNGGRR